MIPNIGVNAMAIKPVPTLTMAGWKKEIRDKADSLMSYFFYSDASQSNIYLGHITSLPKIIEQYGNDKNLIRSQMQTALHVYLSRYFEYVEVNVDVVIPEDATDNRMEILTSVIVGENGVKYDMSRLLRSKYGKIVEIIDRNNTGAV